MKGRGVVTPDRQVSATRSAMDYSSVLAQTDLFSSLLPEELQLLAGNIESIALSRGQCLMREGDPGDCLYVVLEGHLRITQRSDSGEEVQLDLIGPGGSVGEIALLTGERRSASAYAERDSVLLSLARENLERLRQTCPQLVARVSQIVVERIQRAELRDLLFVSGLYQDMCHAALKDLESELQLIPYSSGECLIREGDDSDCSYIVVSGRLLVTDQGRDGDSRVIGELGRGQTAGEMGILTGRKRTATVSAMRDTLVAKLSTEAFSRLLQKYPLDLVKHFAGKVIDRLWLQTVGKSRDTSIVVNIAIIPTEESIRLTEFSLWLAKGLSAYGFTLHLNSERFDAYLGLAGIAQTPAAAPHSANIACWLNRQESAYRYILYQADARPSEWTKRCLRQADRILLVGNAASPPHKGEIEEDLLMDPRYRHLPQSLVILHDTNGPCNGTDAWLRERNLRCHYHVCVGNDEDITRLGRLLSGKGIGLVLSGGGARGFAHIGAIRALREAGIAIDKVGGTSIGSIVAAMAAMRWDYPTMLEQARSFNYRMDYTYPAVALTAGKNVTNQLKSRLGEQKIEDLWTKFFCVSTDLNCNRQYIHDRGLLWKSVRASMSIPGLFPPIVHEAYVLVDGGLVNNMPVDVMRKQEDIGTVIALDVGSPMQMETGILIDGHCSGWRVLTQKLNPFVRSFAVPTLAKTLVMSSLARSDNATETMKNTADLYMPLPLQQFGLLDFQKVKQIAEFGYDYARNKLTEWDQEGALGVLRLIGDKRTG